MCVVLWALEGGGGAQQRDEQADGAPTLVPPPPARERVCVRETARVVVVEDLSYARILHHQRAL